MLLEWLLAGKPSALGVASGIVAGLVTITPAAGFVTPGWAIVMGLLGGAVCYGGVMLKHKLGYDDSLDVLGIHGIGGAFGALATGVFATVGATSVLTGDFHQLYVQLVSIAAAAAYAVAITTILLLILKATMGLRVEHEDEIIGLDQTAHSETGYNL